MFDGQASEYFNSVHHDAAVWDQVCRKVTHVFTWLPRKWTKHKPLQTTVVSNLCFNKNSISFEPALYFCQSKAVLPLPVMILLAEIAVLTQRLYSSVSRENHYTTAIFYARITRNLLRGTWSYIYHFPESVAELCSLQWIFDPLEFRPPGVVSSRLPPGTCIMALSRSFSTSSLLKFCSLYQAAFFSWGYLYLIPGDSNPYI